VVAEIWKSDLLMSEYNKVVLAVKKVKPMKKPLLEAFIRKGR